MYGEDGETEYGGVSKLKNKAIFDFDFAKKIYFSGEYSSALKLLSTKDKYWWTIPEKCKIKMTHWSYFENWDSYRNFVISKKYMGYEESKKISAYANFDQNDTSLYDLHYYLMYLKFGFGRATQDIGIDIRRSNDKRTRLKLVKIYDNEFPEYALRIFRIF